MRAHVLAAAVRAAVYACTIDDAQVVITRVSIINQRASQGITGHPRVGNIG
jgi:hypothetical protein